MSTAPTKKLLDDLTPAERLVAVHLAQGLSNKELSTVLGKAEATIKNQITAVLRTTGASSRCRFIALYHQQLLRVLSDPAPSASITICEDRFLRSVNTPQREKAVCCVAAAGGMPRQRPILQ